MTADTCTLVGGEWIIFDEGRCERTRAFERANTVYDTEIAAEDAALKSEASVTMHTAFTKPL